MKAKKLLGTAFALSALVFAGCQDSEMAQFDAPVQDDVVRSGSDNGAAIPGKYIVVIKAGGLRIPAGASYEQRVSMVKAEVSNILRRNNIQAETDHVYGAAVYGFAASLSADAVAKLSKDSEVAYIEQDRVVSINARPSTGTVTTMAQSTPWGITRVGGGANYTGTATAWVIDTGIDLDHPDLNVDVARSRTFITSGKDAKSADDGNGHGSHVAGTIAAKNDANGVVGVAAGARVVAVKVLGSTGSGSNASVIGGVDYVAATAKNGDVANMSLGGGVSSTIDNAVLNAASKGIKFAIAAGNSAVSATTSSPARVNGANIVTISAFDSSDRLASFSNYGNPPVDFSEPGVSIYSTYKSGGYATLSGTSMACPHAAGILLWGGIRNGGTISGDRDNTPDTIGVR